MRDKTVYPIGKTFHLNGVTYQTEEQHSGYSCEGCSFFKNQHPICYGDSDHHPPCNCCDRNGPSCIFVAVPEPEAAEKPLDIPVGGPVTLKSGRVVQAVAGGLCADCCISTARSECKSLKCLSRKGVPTVYREVTPAPVPAKPTTPESIFSMPVGSVIEKCGGKDEQGRKECEACCLQQHSGQSHPGQCRDVDVCQRNTYYRCVPSTSAVAAIRAKVEELRETRILKGYSTKGYNIEGLDEIRDLIETLPKDENEQLAKLKRQLASAKKNVQLADQCNDRKQTHISDLRKQLALTEAACERVKGQLAEAQTQYDAAIQCHSATEEGWEKELAEDEETIDLQCHEIGDLTNQLTAARTAWHKEAAGLKRQLVTEQACVGRNVLLVVRQQNELSDLRKQLAEKRNRIEALETIQRTCEKETDAEVRAEFAEKLREFIRQWRASGMPGKLSEKLLAYLETPEAVATEVDSPTPTVAEFIAKVEGWKVGYRPRDYIEVSAHCQQVIDFVTAMDADMQEAEARGRANLQEERSLVMGGLMRMQAEKHQVEVKEAEDRGVAEVVAFSAKQDVGCMLNGRIRAKFAPEPEPTMNHHEAMLAVVAGKRMRFGGFPVGSYIARQKSDDHAVLYYMLIKGKPVCNGKYKSCPAAIDATDWVVVQEATDE